MDASWNNITRDPSTLANIAQQLGFHSAEELPPITALTDSQIALIQTRVGRDIASTIRSHLSDVAEPVLEPAETDFGDGSVLALVMMELNAKLGEMQANVAKEGVKADKLKLENVSKQRLDQIKEAIKKMDEASKSGLLGKIFGWIGAIVGLIAAVAATVLTGGALAGVALTLAVVGIAMLVMEETGGMEKLMTAMFGDNEKAKMAFQIALMAVMLVASLATGGASLAKSMGDSVKIAANATRLATGISKVANASVETIQAGAKMTQIGSSLIGALAQIGGGAAGIHTAVVNYQTAETTAKSKELEAWLAKLQSQLEDEQEALEKAIQLLNTGAFQIPSEILESIKESWNSILGAKPA